MRIDRARRVAFNSGLLVCGRAFQIASGVILLAVIARYLGQEGLGIYGFVIAFVELFAVVVQMGVPRIVVREVARDKQQTASYLANARVLLCAVAAVLLLVLTLLAWVTVSEREVLPAILIYFVSQVIFYVGEIYFAVFRAYERMEYQTVVVVVSRGVMMILVLLSIYLDLGLGALFLMMLTANVANVLFAHYLMSRRFVAPTYRADWRFLKHLVKNAAPVGMSFILRTYFWQSAMVFLVTLKGETAAGALYGPLRLMEHSKVLPFAFVASMLPVLSSQAPSSKSSFASSLERAFKVSLVAGALCGIAFTSLSDHIVALLLGPEFSQSVQALQVLGWVPALLFPNLLLGMSLVALDKQVLETLILFVGLIVSLTSNLVLIPRYGFLGPCYGILLAEAVFLVVSLVYLWRYLASVLLATMAAKVLVCTLAFALLIRLGRGYNDVLALSTGLLVFVGGLFVLRAVDREELSTLKRLVFDRSRW